MPSRSPGQQPAIQPCSIHVGRPNESLQSVTSFTFRHKRYVAYVSGSRLLIFSAPNVLVQAITFLHPIVAVASHPTSGQLVIAQEKDVLIFEPIAEGWTRLWWESSTLLRRRDEKDVVATLSWTSQGEILVGGSLNLSMFSTRNSRRASIAMVNVNSQEVEERMPLWTKPVASAVKYAASSPSGNLIASTGRYDRLVKIWRRLSFEEASFDYAYLSHPNVVTHLEWKVSRHRHKTPTEGAPSSRHEEDPEVLVTLAADGLLRLWTSGSSHDRDILTLYSTIDLVSAIPSSPNESMKDTARTSSPPRYAFLLPADDICDAISDIVASAGEKTSHALEHLKEIASNYPDCFVIMDGAGRMSAWGIRSIGHKRRPGDPSADEPFHVAHAEGMAFTLLPAQYTSFAVWLESGKIQCLSHTFDRCIQWWEGSLETFLSPSAPSDQRLLFRAEWTGHRATVIGLVTMPCGQGAVTWADNGELVVWKHTEGHRLEWALASTTAKAVSRIEIPKVSTSAVIFQSDGISVFSMTSGRISATQKYDFNWTRPFASGSIGQQVIVMDDTGKFHTITTPDSSKDDFCIKSTGEIPFPDGYTPTFMVISSVPTDATSFCVTCANVAGTIAHVRTRLDALDQSEALQWTFFETGVLNATVFDANSAVATLASSKERKIAIVDLVEGYIEHESQLENDPQHVTCSPGIDVLNSVALACGDRIDIYSQARYSRYQHAKVWTVETLDFRAPSGTTITSLKWQGDGELVVATVNGLMTVSPEAKTKQLQQPDTQPVLTNGATAKPVVDGLLAAWHPELLECLVQYGRTASALDIIHRLLTKLRFWTEGDKLSLGPDLASENVVRDIPPSRVITLEPNTGNDLAEQLREKRLPAMTVHDQRHLSLVVKALVFVATHIGGLDKCAVLYLFHWQLRLLQLQAHDRRRESNEAEATDKKRHLAPEMSWREITFALHSKTQQALLDILTAQYDNAITWPVARSLGITAWLSDRDALRQVFETLAQSTYRATSPADPINASLYFLALNKKSTLLGLWRIATWHREQKATLNFLKRDFTQAESRTAAKKNAYALMGKRRFEYAAAFFLLADDCPSAVSVLAGQCEDVMLAVAVARLFNETGESVALSTLISDRLLPLAKQNNDRWWMSWCYSMLSDHSQAADALVRPLQGPRTWTQDDPATLLLYRNLRKRSSPHEYGAVLRGVRVFARMGLLPFALDLLRSWDFIHRVDEAANHAGIPNGESSASIAQKPSGSAVNGHATSMLDDFTSPPASTTQQSSLLDQFTSDDSVPSDQAARQAKAAELLKKLRAKKEGASAEASIEARPKPPPTQFQEPDPNSLLDSFGF